MVKEEEKDGERYFICEECKFAYAERVWAEKCEQWCREKHSCNIEITKHAIKSD